MQPRVGSLGSLEDGQASHVRTLNQSNKSCPLKLVLILFLVLVVIVFSFINIYSSRYVLLQNAASMSQTKLQHCYEEPKNVEHYTRPPSTPFHEMNDTDLFWRASFEPRIKKYPFRRIPKIAFMFLTRGPLPMSPLWDKFFKGHDKLYSIYIHSSPSYKPDFPPSSAFYGRQIPSQVAEWGMMSMCDAERRLLANALLDMSNEWFILLSEACIPLHSFRIVYRYISSSKHSFLGSFDDPGPYGRGRYNFMMHPEVNLTNWRKGSQWFEINRKLAIDIVQDDFYYPKFEKYCRPDCYVDEHYFPTMLSIQSPHLLANRTLTWVDWSRGGPHPATYGKDDIRDGFFKEISHSDLCSYNNHPANLCYLFARKFAPSALDLLLEHSLEFFGF